MAQRLAGTAALVSLLACGCGDAHRSDGTAGIGGDSHEGEGDAEQTSAGAASNRLDAGEPGPESDAGATAVETTGDAGSGAAGSGAGPVASWAQLQPLCQQHCAQAEPPPPETNECMNSSVSTCVSSCRRATEDVDLACGKCIAEGVQWETAQGGCSEWECVCSEGWARFALPSQAPCDVACAPNLARRAEQRLAMPRPSSLGRMPEDVVELEDLRSIHALAATDSTVWIGAEAWPGGPPAILGRLDEALALTWTTSPRGGDWEGRRIKSLLAAPDGGVLLTIGESGTGTLARYAASGDLQFAVDMPTGGRSASLHTLGWATDSNVHAMFEPGAVALYDARTGDELSRDTIPGTSEYTDHAYTTQLDSNGDRYWGGVEGGRPSAGLLAKVVDAGDPASPAEVEAWRVRLAGDDGDGQVWKLTVDANDFVVVIGWLHAVRKQGISSASYGAPFVARYDPEGNELWRWQHAGIVPGRLYDVITDADGNVYTSGQEDPTAYADPPPAADEVVCSVYGCDGLVVRKLGVDGQLLWEYQHREDTSAGVGLAFDSTGRLLVGGSRTREETVALILRFDP